MITVVGDDWQGEPYRYVQDHCEGTLEWSTNAKDRLIKPAPLGLSCITLFSDKFDYVSLEAKHFKSAIGRPTSVGRRMHSRENQRETHCCRQQDQHMEELVERRTSGCGCWVHTAVVRRRVIFHSRVQPFFTRFVGLVLYF